jgi:hypothetical protein
VSTCRARASFWLSAGVLGVMSREISARAIVWHPVRDSDRTAHLARSGALVPIASSRARIGRPQFGFGRSYAICVYL